MPRMAGRALYELLPQQPGLGLERLPAPSPGDVFFDLEFERVKDSTTLDRVRQLRSERFRSLRFVEAVVGRLEGSLAALEAEETSP